MPHRQKNFFVITGGPGSGKTTLLDALACNGFARTHEAGRAVIREQTAMGGTGLPWSDRSLFAELMLSRELQSYREARELTDRCAVLFDRGVPDVAGYLKLEGLPVPAHIASATRACLYSLQVFVAPPWQEIYVQDSERRQDFETARRTCEVISRTYRDLGYDTIEIPRCSLEERVVFVSERIGRP